MDIKTMKHPISCNNVFNIKSKEVTIFTKHDYCDLLKLYCCVSGMATRHITYKAN